MEVLGDAQHLLNRVQQAVKAAGKQMDKAKKKQVKADSAQLQKLLTKIRVDKITREEVEDLRRCKAQLEATADSLLNGGM